jgi:threonine dehydratase
VEVWAAEPAGADDAARSFAAGEWIPQLEPRTIADGLLTSLGQLTWPILRDLGCGVITVSEEEIVEAMRLCWERAKLMIEPSSAVAVAAAGKGWTRGAGPERVGVILSGGNVDLDRLPWVGVARGA